MTKNTFLDRKYFSRWQFGPENRFLTLFYNFNFCREAFPIEKTHKFTFQILDKNISNIYRKKLFHYLQ